MKNILIALFHVLDYLDQFKAIKENLLKGVGHLYPLRTPTYLRLSQKPKFVGFFGISSLDNELIDEGFDEVQNDTQDMDEGDAVLEASVGDALEDAVMQDFSDVVARGSPVNEENFVAKMEEDVEIDVTRGRDKSVPEPESNQVILN